MLEVLTRTSRPLTGREVHRLAGTGSESGVRLVLGRLVEHGLVTATQAGRATLYVGNRDHIAWQAVEMLTGLRQALFTRLHDFATTLPVRPITLAVFGSAARGDGDTDSDIDILAVHRSGRDDEAWTAQIDDLRDRVIAWTGNPCQIYDLTDIEFDQHVTAGEPIVDEWRVDAVTVLGTPPDQLIGMGAA